MSAMIRTALGQESRRDLRAAAIHEAGHLVALHALGGFGRAEVWANPSATHETKLWVGRAWMYAPPARPKDWGVIVGAAGKVAELLNAGESVDSIVADSADWLFELSDTDAALMGSRWTFGRIERTARLLTVHWPDVLRESRALRGNALWALDAASYSHLTTAHKTRLVSRVLGEIR